MSSSVPWVERPHAPFNTLKKKTTLNKPSHPQTYKISKTLETSHRDES